VLIIQLHAEHGVGQSFQHRRHHFDCVFLSHTCENDLT
jgi:hypothetical protein